jgi:AbrB family looped-hinge helix DNA binding protein
MFDRHFFGSTTIGERGQVVIPNDARKELNLKKGDKLLVFGMPHGTLVLARPESFEHFSNALKAKQKVIDKILKKSKI